VNLALRVYGPGAHRALPTAGDVLRLQPAGLRSSGFALVPASEPAAAVVAGASRREAPLPGGGGRSLPSAPATCVTSFVRPAASRATRRGIVRLHSFEKWSSTSLLAVDR
jgi:hypothetical protein